jgi:hypothetical protein
MSISQVGLKPNLVISVAELGCIESWKLAGPQLIALVPSSEYWLIVPDNQLQEVVSNSPAEYKVFPESFFMQDFAERLSRCKGAALPARRGWYLQQLLKLEALSRASHLDRVVIWDADTIPLKDISFFDSQGNCSYFFGSENHLLYFANIYKLLGSDKAHQNSFIAQNFPITGNQIQAFFSYIERRHQSKWWDAVIESIDFDEASGFSEYEALGTFVCLFENTPLTIQPGTWSRDGNLKLVAKQIRSKKAHKGNFDYVAVESWTKKGLVFQFFSELLKSYAVSFEESLVAFRNYYSLGSRTHI